jgi:beta-N-acetylhexosaminidase
MIDLAGTELTAGERERLAHPLVGGVILFSRNYSSPAQLAELTAAVKAVRNLPIAVDHEGGRVQRFRDGFTRLPAMRSLGELWERDQQAASEAVHGIGYVLASELRVHGVDLSFTPDLDLDWGRSTVIGNRAFHHDPAVVASLAGALIDGLHEAGMIACGKHFPGHGWVEADSHVAIPVDSRGLADLHRDLTSFRLLIDRRALDAIMPAHVIFSQIDDRPAGFSPVWLGILRNELSFEGVIFSDDLSMEGASVVGGIIERADAAWDAGCDMLLVCNQPGSVDTLLEHWQRQPDATRSARLAGLLPRLAAPRQGDLVNDPLYQQGLAQIAALANLST